MLDGVTGSEGRSRHLKKCGSGRLQLFPSLPLGLNTSCVGLVFLWLWFGGVIAIGFGADSYQIIYLTL